jgi:hypothetical protein
LGLTRGPGDPRKHMQGIGSRASQPERLWN